MATIREMGNGVQVQIRRKGYPQVTRTYQNKTRARQEARKIEAQMDMGQWVDLEEARETSLGQALERYRKTVSVTKKGWEQEDQRCRRIQKDELADYSLANIRGQQIAAFRDRRLEQGLSPATVKNDMAVISHLFRVAISEWGMENLDNPVAKVRKPKLPDGRDRRLEPGEEDRLLSKAQEMDPELKALIIVALETGMRSSELLRITWSDVDLGKGVIKKLDKTKNGAFRGVPLSTRSIEALRGLEAKEMKVFRWKKANGVSQRFRDLLEAVNREAETEGVKPILGLRFHDLRHEATSRFFENTDWSMMKIAAVTGHKDFRMLQRYTHLRADRMAKELNE